MRKWLPLMTICLGTFMLLIDVTIVNVALPDMVGDLDASFGALQWVINAYALALGALVSAQVRSPTSSGTAARTSPGSRSSRPRH